MLLLINKEDFFFHIKNQETDVTACRFLHLHFVTKIFLCIYFMLSVSSIKL